MKLYKYIMMLIVCISIAITSNIYKSSKQKKSQQKRKELIREVQNFSEGQKQAKQKEIIRDYNYLIKLFSTHRYGILLF